MCQENAGGCSSQEERDWVNYNLAALFANTCRAECKWAQVHGSRTEKKCGQDERNGASSKSSALYKSCLPPPPPTAQGFLQIPGGTGQTGHLGGGSPFNKLWISPQLWEPLRTPWGASGKSPGTTPESAFWIYGAWGPCSSVFKSFWGDSSVKTRRRTSAQVNAVTVWVTACSGIGI